MVTTFSRFLSISLAEVATIGDMPNDFLMFRTSSLSIAMGNAGPEVKRQPHCVTNSYNDDGFAKAIEWFILNRAPSIAAEAP